MTTPAVTVRLASWHNDHDRDRLISVRREVFVISQSVPQALEIDGLDPEHTHFLAEKSANGEAIGTARLADCGKIGRVAVVKKWRREGVGFAIIKAVIASAEERSIAPLYLHAQTTTLPFYEKLGFFIDPTVAEFFEAGIPHRRMIRARNRRQQISEQSLEIDHDILP